VQHSPREWHPLSEQRQPLREEIPSRAILEPREIGVEIEFFEQQVASDGDQ